MTSRLRTFWETYFRPPTIEVNGVELPVRNVINFIADGTLPEDDEDNERTNVPIGGALSPGGAVGDMQVHVLDGEAPRLGGTSNLRVNQDTEEVEHAGSPAHFEDHADFVDPADREAYTDGDPVPLARPQWRRGATTDDAPTVIGSISVPASVHGDGGFTVFVENTYAYASSGTKHGSFSGKGTFRRSSGTLARTKWRDTSDPDDNFGTAPGGIELDVGDDDTIDLIATGIAAQDITWTSSFHIQVVPV